MLIKVFLCDRCRGLNGRPLISAILFVPVFDHVSISANSPERDGPVRSMAVKSSNSCPGATINLDLLVEPQVIEEDVPSLVIILQNLLQGFSRARRDTGQTRR